MTLSGAAAQARPGIDTLAAVPLGIVTHIEREVDNRGTKRRLSVGNGTEHGRIEPATGAYRTAAAQMTEAERREAGLRRNGRPR
jgi:hypothetical protein